ncbi:MAG TPA: RNA 2',3'-cyclic phosphodiesterase [Candidatus Limnocylindrales bacterium]|nr:RNA 2',3'-cyclic phosphodiesterase [Candidatus Limnocylindrales bacterium]
MIAEPRLFVAVPIQEEARAAIAAIVETIRAGEPPGKGVRWVRLDGLHVTLRFLGPTTEDRVDAVASAVREAAADGAPFELRIHGAGAFPAAGRPRTLWLAIHAGGEALAALAGALDERLEPAGWPRSDRPFRAHLTLARADGVRVGSQTAAALRAAAAELDLTCVADRLVLYESVTGGGRARYVSRAEATLGGDEAVLPSRRPRVGLREHRQGAPNTS